MPGQVIGYVRVSSTDQNPERQVIAIREALPAESDRCFTTYAQRSHRSDPAGPTY